MKKLLTVALATCIAVTGCVAFAACGGESDYDHTIVFYSSQGDDLSKVTQNAIASFEAKYPGWKVEHSQPGGYDEVLSKVRGDLTAGLQPDLAYCYADHVAQYLDTGTVVDMNKYLTNSQSYTYTAGENTKKIDRIGFTDEDVSKFIPGYFEEGKAKNFGGHKAAGYEDDALLTLPFVKSTELLYYNPDALKTLGVEVPTTWDELWSICEKAKQQWPTCTPLGYDSDANWFITMAEQLGFGYTSPDDNQHFLFNNENAAAWLEKVADYYNKGYIITQATYEGAYTSSLFVKGPENNGLVFCIGSSGGASNQAGTGFVTDVAPIPGVDENHNQCISQGPSLVMLTGGHGVTNPSEKEIMTFQFVKELLDVEFQAQFAKASGYNPMRTDVYEVASYKSFLEGEDTDNGGKLKDKQLVVAKAANAAQVLSNRFFVSPAFIGSSTARSCVGTVMERIFLNGMEPAEALRKAYKDCGGK